MNKTQFASLRIMVKQLEKNLQGCFPAVSVALSTGCGNKHAMHGQSYQSKVDPAYRPLVSSLLPLAEGLYKSILFPCHMNIR